jgi:hypothetical protein
VIGDGAGAWRARRVAASLEPDERDLMLGWIDALLEIRASRRAGGAKAQAVLAATFDRDLLLLLGKALALEVRRSAWDDQNLSVRAALVVAAIVSLALAGALVGFVLLAAVIATPLWLAFGDGLAWLVALRRELVRLMPPDDEDPDLARPL